MITYCLLKQTAIVIASDNTAVVSSRRGLRHGGLRRGRLSGRLLLRGGLRRLLLPGSGCGAAAASTGAPGGRRTRRGGAATAAACSGSRSPASCGGTTAGPLVVALAVGGHVLVVLLSAFLGHLLVALFHLWRHVCPATTQLFGHLADGVARVFGLHFESLLAAEDEVRGERLFGCVRVFLLFLRLVCLHGLLVLPSRLLVALLVALLDGRVDGGPAPAELFGHFGDAVVGELRFHLKALLLREEEVGGEGFLGCVRVLHGLLIGLGLSGLRSGLDAGHDGALLHHTVARGSCICTVIEDGPRVVDNSVDDLS